MFRVSPKGISYGTLIFFALMVLSSVASNVFNVSLVNGPISWIYLGTWIIPGYIAAKVSGKSGVLNGALVGVIVGLLVGLVSQLIFSNPPPKVESIRGIEVGLRMALSALILCGLGGLIWELHNASRKRGL